ncbi:MAG: hypothetical protein PF508_01775 [Spirochaeta sp.]|jgi:hypothetical protein|nr:hypothetical protein [Spirochaeta sp.]
MAAFQTSTEVTEWQFPLAREHGMTPDLGLTAGFRYILRVEIVDVYPGTTWEDTCIAEIWPDYGAITAVAVASDDRTLTASFRGAAPFPTYRSLEYALTVVETSDNGEWVIVAREPYYDQPRHPTSYALVHAPSGRNVSQAILGKPVGGGTQTPFHAKSTPRR